MAAITHHSNVADITLPDKIQNLEEPLFLPHRQLEGHYRSLPWPAQMQQVVILTHVTGGRGDVSAAAKTIAIMQRMCPTLSFDWVLIGANRLDPMSFLHCDDPSKVRMRPITQLPSEMASVDFLLEGPVKLGLEREAIENRIRRNITGPTFTFLENAHSGTRLYGVFLRMLAQKATTEGSAETTYQKLHPEVFPSQTIEGVGALTMGLQPGSGVLLDQALKNANLSRKYCCPSYIAQIQDGALRKDILGAMHLVGDQTEPDYDRYSFNFGYAHRPASWESFIECVAIHEQTKDVVIVLNQQGEFNNFSTQQFKDQIFTTERLVLLAKKGYSSVVLKGQEAGAIQVTENAQSGRSLTVIIRPSFDPNDMAPMQLAAERHLATGNNSAVEAWCARSQLYLYESVDNGGHSKAFLQQQVDLAQTISPNLGKLLALFGKDCMQKTASSGERTAELERLLQDPDLGRATLAFCTHITENYSFDGVLEGALKRAAWHHVIPGLAKLESEMLNEKFRTGLVTYLQASEVSENMLKFTTDPELGNRVHETVQRFLSK